MPILASIAALILHLLPLTLCEEDIFCEPGWVPYFAPNRTIVKCIQGIDQVMKDQEVSEPRSAI